MRTNYAARRRAASSRKRSQHSCRRNGGTDPQKAPPVDRVRDGATNMEDLRPRRRVSPNPHKPILRLTILFAHDRTSFLGDTLDWPNITFVPEQTARGRDLL